MGRYCAATFPVTVLAAFKSRTAITILDEMLDADDLQGHQAETLGEMVRQEAEYVAAGGQADQAVGRTPDQDAAPDAVEMLA